MIRSIRFTLTLWYVGILSLILIFFSWNIYQKLDSNLDRQASAVLSWQADTVADVIYQYWQKDFRGHQPKSIADDSRSHRLGEVIGRWAGQSKDLERYSIRLLDKDGQTLVASKAFDQLKLAVSQSVWQRASQANTVYQTYRVLNQKYRMVTRPIVEDGTILYFVQIVGSLNEVQIALDELKNSLIWTVPVILLLSSVVGWGLAALALRPVAVIVEKVQKISVRDLHQRVKAPGTHDEIETLAKTFNELLTRLEKSFKRLRQFSAATAHELRTPISILLGEVEVTLRKDRTKEEYQEALKNQLDVLREFSTIVEQLLSIAHAEEGEEMDWKSDLDLQNLLNETLDQWRKVAAKKNINLHYISRDGLKITGQPKLIDRLVSNLLENAMKHTPSGGQVWVELASEQENACIAVEDSGPGIPDEERAHVFDKFFNRNAHSQAENGGSVGLGLGLCQWIAEAHQGHVELAQKSPGRGARFIVRIPIRGRLLTENKQQPIMTKQ